MEVSLMIKKDKSEKIVNLLKKNGWRIRSFAETDSVNLIAKYPNVQDKKEIRKNLNEIGLLISPDLRIRFLEKGANHD